MTCPSDSPRINPLPQKIFFGQYLVQRGVISQLQLQEALALQERQNQLLGALAAARGYMQEDHIRETIQRQKTLDLPFGTVAVRLGFLSPRQLDDLLFTQNVHTTHVGEALMELGHLSNEVFSRVLQDYNQDEKLRLQEIDRIMDSTPHADILAAGIQAMQRGFARFTREPIKILPGFESPHPDFAWMLTLGFTLSTQRIIELNIHLTHEDALKIARKFAHVSSPASCDLRCLGRNLLFFTFVKRYLRASLTNLGYEVVNASVSANSATARSISDEIMCLASPAGRIGLCMGVETREATREAIDI